MFNIRQNLSRRKLLTFLGILALLFGLAPLHPYPRQSLFGPKLHGEPWCVWEDEFRREAHPEAYEQLWSTRIRRLLRIEERRRFDKSEKHDPELLPLLLLLSRDQDYFVRRRIVGCMQGFPEWFRDPVAREELLELLEEGDLKLRVDAAKAHWQIFQDTRVFPVMLKDSQIRDMDLHERLVLIDLLGEMCVKDKALLPKHAILMDDKDFAIRKEFLNVGCSLFGPDILPQLIRGLRDDTADVRAAAVFRIASLHKEARNAAPALEAMLKDERDAGLWPDIRRALAEIDPKRYPDRPDKKDY